LDEFVGDLDISGDLTVDATVGLRRAEELYDRVFFEYGDDSVAQLGGVHLACEQSSNLLTKVLEWGRLMSYLEQSTRYIAYDTRIGGRYRFYRDPAVLGSPLGTRYVGDMDRLFDTYAELVPLLSDFFRERFPKEPSDTDFVYRQAVRAKAFDALPALVRSYAGDRTNRRHTPGRALERSRYRFAVLADYGAFRDLHRHRMPTVEWQPLSPRHGYTRPEAVEMAGHAKTFDAAME